MKSPALLAAFDPDVVAVQLSGGLGNQLFQYAAGRAASLRLGCPLWLDLSFLSASHGVTRREFALGPCMLKAAPLHLSEEGWAEHRQEGFAFDAAFEHVTTGAKLIGNFQSELFFVSGRDEVRRDLTAATPTNAAYRTALHAIWREKEPAAIHVRRGDYMRADVKAFHGLLGRPYYKAAVAHLRERRAPSHFFVFSDDPEEAARVLDGLCDFTLVEGSPDDPWRDMKLMAACSHHIMANSSFSWWGSWLSTNPDKMAVAPRDWFARDVMRRLNTIDLHPSSTVLIRPGYR